MSGMMVFLYLFLFFAVGAGGTLFLILWLIGPFARELGIGHIKGDKFIQYPKEDNTWGLLHVSETDEYGNWVFENNNGQTRRVKTKPRDAKIEGGKCPLAIGMPKSAFTTSPEEAIVADKSESDHKGYEIWGETINMNKIKKELRGMFGAGQYASMFSAAFDASKPMVGPSSGGVDKGTALKIGGIATVIILIIVGFYVVTKMNLF